VHQKRLGNDEERENNVRYGSDDEDACAWPGLTEVVENSRNCEYASKGDSRSYGSSSNAKRTEVLFGILR
jgi:hypothetical protein